MRNGFLMISNSENGSLINSSFRFFESDYNLTIFVDNLKIGHEMILLDVKNVIVKKDS